MSRGTRSVPFVLVLVGALFAAQAQADPRWRRGDGDDHDHGRGRGRAEYYAPRYHGGPRYYAPRSYAPRYYGPRYVVRPAPVYPVYEYYEPGPEAYYCGPCAHPFVSYDALAYHVHHLHHVAVVTLPSVIVHGSIGAGVGWFFDF